MQRTGTCNRCGECCGYPNPSGKQCNPWPGNWPEALRTWEQTFLEANIPIFRYLRHPQFGGAQFGSVKIQGTTHHWIWAPGKGLCTDLPAYGDPSTYDQRCPFLNGKQCALVGTPAQFVYDEYCSKFPPLELGPEQVAEFFTNCPSCSYVYS